MTSINITVNNQDIFPIMGRQYNAKDFAKINLDKDHLSQLNIDTEDGLKSYLSQCQYENKALWLIGGYMEHRSLYQSDLFDGTHESVRDIHLGVDIWGPVNSSIHLPIDGVIHSFGFNDKLLDYGYTLVVKHSYEGQEFHTLYGHLSSSHIDIWKVGDTLSAGEIVGTIGSILENGGWLPHLHFQIIIDLEGNKGDYPGVCSRSRVNYFGHNCPNPEVLIKKAP